MKKKKVNWLDVDETCPTCGQVTKQVRGITKQNLKKLLIPKWNMTEVIITLLFIALIVLSFLYKNETQQCRDFLEPMYADDGIHCNIVCENKCNLIQNGVMGDTSINSTNLDTYEFYSPR